MPPVKKKQHMCIGFFSLMALLFAVVAQAQTPLPEAAGVANLTITVTLDKPLDEQTVGHYRKLAQQLVLNLPTEITRPDDLKLLIEGDTYKNMHVVAFFPVIDGKADTQAVIKNYRLRFVHTDALQPDPSPPVVVAREGYLSVTPAMGVSIRLQKPGTEPAAPRKDIVLPEAKPQADVVARPKPEPLVINFVADSVNLTIAERQRISDMAANLRDRSDIQGYAAIVATHADPRGGVKNTGDMRLQQIIALLRQLDVDVSRASVTEVHVQTRRQQYVRLEVDVKEEGKK